MTNDKLIIGGHEFNSRFILGSGKYSMNLIEAAARGRYIIATDVRGNADVVKQSGYGALVKLDDDAAMAEAVKDVIRRNYESRMPQIENYSVESYIACMMRFYNCDKEV